MDLARPQMKSWLPRVPIRKLLLPALAAPILGSLQAYSRPLAASLPRWHGHLGRILLASLCSVSILSLRSLSAASRYAASSGHGA